MRLSKDKLIPFRFSIEKRGSSFKQGSVKTLLLDKTALGSRPNCRIEMIYCNKKFYQINEEKMKQILEANKAKFQAEPMRMMSGKRARKKGKISPPSRFDESEAIEGKDDNYYAITKTKNLVKMAIPVSSCPSLNLSFSKISEEISLRKRNDSSLLKKEETSFRPKISPISVVQSEWSNIDDIFLQKKPDDQNYQIHLNLKGSHSLKEPKELKEAKEPKEPREPKEPKEPRELRELREPKEPRESKEPKETKE